jgi:hypothetical protein
MIRLEASITRVRKSSSDSSVLHSPSSIAASVDRCRLQLLDRDVLGAVLVPLGDAG